MQKEFQMRGIELIKLRRKTRMGTLSQLEYANFLMIWYNIRIENKEFGIRSVVDLVRFIKDGTTGTNGSSRLENMIAKSPVSISKNPMSLGPFYLVLFKFLCSWIPYTASQTAIAEILSKRLIQNGYKVEFEHTKKNPSVTLCRGVVTFHIR